MYIVQPKLFHGNNYIIYLCAYLNHLHEQYNNNNNHFNNNNNY